MRIASVLADGSLRVGVVVDDHVHLLDRPVTVLSLLQEGTLLDAGREALRARAVALADVRLLAPLEPPSVRDFVTFEEHVEGMRAPAGLPDAWYDAPTFYFSNPAATLGPADDVPVPPGCAVLDFELEVAAVIGRTGRDVASADGWGHVAGLTILNDWSARDLQSREMQVGLGPAKGKDTATTLGPWLVTADEFTPDGEGFLDLALRASVNGTVVGEDLLSNMGWPFGDLIAYASRGTELRPGDVLGSGTCGNGGCLGELWGRGASRTDLPPLTPGDVVTLDVEGIGTLTSRVVPGATPTPIPRARPRPRTRPAHREHA
ncbi:2-keto-4-pentenoate hydratase/2-oxohepta-3-ene-1,7-dioic acid hydratase in catechol pathway [Actinomycetospora succinea]|uniref:2-keto-4-pentenoate hydratase/2-oxohepta-3-ene-1,7-dioic acid hydratase in catechol pathway n=1 Tax=Actinomycetospora succinea TaxID=663603 RepID=A0A4R6VSW9_9PSEU|nr:fumarylacetoacetate hydrolase family protein [Actinomycetospora succinea]TDQ65714.1 2-keto-4-pentenoate hydratase/2-oxohepta-3-ene-1,7-dioic acid hydratase in catechol pathway [Actinomycetospora succinea]